MHVQIIPALERALSLVGADMHAWFAALPRPQRLLPQKRPAAAVGLAAPAPGGPGAATAATIDATTCRATALCGTSPCSAHD